MQRNSLITLLIIILSVGLIAAQDAPPLPQTPECDATTLNEQLITFNELLSTDFNDDPLAARENLFRLGTLYTDLALTCGYQPTEQEVNTLIQQTLSLADMTQIVAANAIGDDVDAIMTDLDTLIGDPLSGQLLYNGIENALDGTALGCSGCHLGEVAPLTEGTWTRINDIRLNDPALEGYSVRQYIVESIVLPNVYITPDYIEGLMPNNYGTRLDIQQLADIVAYLESQDQLLEDLD